jgi:hypothetical protein
MPIEATASSRATTDKMPSAVVFTAQVARGTGRMTCSPHPSQR